MNEPSPGRRPDPEPDRTEEIKGYWLGFWLVIVPVTLLLKWLDGISSKW